MANTLGNFNVPLFAATALDILMNSLSTPRRVNRAYESERRAFDKGDVVNIRRPSTFTVYDAPIGTSADDLKTESVQIALDQYKETKMAVTDRELAYTTEQIIREHISPMAYALGNSVDAALLAQSYLIPHCQQITAASAGIEVLTGADRIMRENRVPDDGPSRRHYAANPRVWERWIGNAAFAQHQGAAAGGVATQETAQLAQKYGFQPYPTNNGLAVAAQATPTVTTGLTNGAHDKGATSIALDATTFTGTLAAGMVIQIGAEASTAGQAYNQQLYSVTANVTASGNAATVSISPPLRADVADGVAWTVKVNAAAAAYQTELAFHSDCLALCMVPLPGAAPGAEIQTATDAASGVSVRARYYYDGHLAKRFFAMDILYGVKVLNADLGVRGIVV